MKVRDIEAEIAQVKERLAYNQRMRWEAAPRSRFAYAAHVTRLTSKLNRLERERDERSI